ncbi:hypothetical protein BCR36DRAFT_453272 [Piromyces finnis]|uniref:Uncharacterized protein n=1 Tax=Piromyces finnis TaxID=1754191 RepID=A0A1Y1VLN2_9FUNG|nr:hypothetical protein BCR36DRAFT_453272 [Piromyces finnis]|eukprot:ORX59055.1 hypothetical protein BCR36DRAFT_453272 [Piromyces finnis]
MESYKFNDKNDSNNSNSEKYFALDIKEEADFKNKKNYVNYLVSGDGKKINNFNHNYFESIDSLNPQDPFTDYENTSIMNSIKNSEFQNGMIIEEFKEKFSSEFRSKETLQNSN